LDRDLSSVLNGGALRPRRDKGRQCISRQSLLACSDNPGEPVLTGGRQVAECGLAAARAFDDLSCDALAYRMLLAGCGGLANTVQRDIHVGERAGIECPLDKHR